jgi:2-polyprenyl-6-methoxyphenol hydroxylase-like FAD-dependent oxidoreductase
VVCSQEPQLTPLHLGQQSNEGLLRQSLLDRFGVVVELGTELVDFEQSSDYVTARLRKHAADDKESVEETVRLQYLVGTDGGKSTVRKKLGLSFFGESRTEAILFCDVAVKGLDEEVSGDIGCPQRTNGSETCVSTCTPSVIHWTRCKSSLPTYT